MDRYYNNDTLICGYHIDGRFANVQEYFLIEIVTTHHRNTNIQM